MRNFGIHWHPLTKGGFSKSFNSIQAYISYDLSKDKIIPFLWKPKTSDEEYIYKAIINKCISKPVHTCYYKNWAEYLIHLKIYKFQNEFKQYDIRHESVQEWFYIRKENLIKKIHQIRLRYWFWNNLTF